LGALPSLAEVLQAVSRASSSVFLLHASEGPLGTSPRGFVAVSALAELPVHPLNLVLAGTVLQEPSIQIR
jgi:hypothetical protein